MARSAAWTRKEGQDPAGGLNARGRAAYKAATGGTLRPPVKSGDDPRRASFLARMGAVRGPMVKDGKPTRLALALRAWGASSKEDARKKARAISRRLREGNQMKKTRHNPIMAKKTNAGPRGYFANPIINGINRTWQTFAGGTGAYNPNHNSYAMYLENNAMFSIDPPQRRGGAYRMQSFNITKPSWTDHGSFRSPQAAKTEAKRILESGEGRQRFRNPSKRKLKPVNRPSQAGGAASAPLRARRKKTNAGPRGFFANPRRTPSISGRKYKGFDLDSARYILTKHYDIGRDITVSETKKEIDNLLRKQKAGSLDDRGEHLATRILKNPVHTFKVLTRSKASAPFALVGSFRDKSRAMQYARAIHKASPTSLSVKVTT